MRILIDIGHPAHVHLFKHFAHEMISRGHKLHFTCRDREFIKELLQQEGLSYTCFGRNYQSTTGKLWGLFRFTCLLLCACLKLKPDILLSHGSMYAAFTAFFIRKPHISFEDTFNFEQVRLYKPFTTAILTGTYDHPLKSKKVVRYPGYHELAYLHPNRFMPDNQVLIDLGIEEGEKYVIIRFVAWSASHDIGHKGMSYGNKTKAINTFSKYARVFISSETPLPAELQPYSFPLPPHRMHDAMAFASLVFGESATMPSEASMLGVPSIFIHNNTLYYLKELQEKYGLVFLFSESTDDQQEAILKGVELLTKEGVKEEWQQKRSKMLQEKTDVTAWLINYLDNFYRLPAPKKQTTT